MSALKGITKKGGKRTKHGGLWAEGEGKNPKKLEDVTYASPLVA